MTLPNRPSSTGSRVPAPIGVRLVGGKQAGTLTCILEFANHLYWKSSELPNVVRLPSTETCLSDFNAWHKVHDVMSVQVVRLQLSMMTSQFREMSLLEAVVWNVLGSLHSLTTATEATLTPLALDTLQSEHATHVKMHQLMLKNEPSSVCDQLLSWDISVEPVDVEAHLEHHGPDPRSTSLSPQWGIHIPRQIRPVPPRW